MPQILKVDLHTHTAEDPNEKINYNAYQLIDRASKEGYDVLAITNHDTITYNKELAEYAREKGILLIPGTEAQFSNKHVLIINPGFKEVPLGKQLKYLGKIKRATSLIIAPHPFFPSSISLKSDFLSHFSLFDAIEFSHYYNHVINCNKKAAQVAYDSKMPLIGSSDCHSLWQFGTTYSLVKAKKETFSIIEAIKKGEIEVSTTPLSLISMARIAINSFWGRKLKVSFRL